MLSLRMRIEVVGDVEDEDEENERWNWKLLHRLP